jgi:hypothetical protein
MLIVVIIMALLLKKDDALTYFIGFGGTSKLKL